MTETTYAAKRLTVFALAAFLAVAATLSGAVPSAAEPAAATGPELVLPAIGPDGLTPPLTADQLTPTEQAAYAGLQPDSADARQYLYTRGYLRYCKQVVDGTRPALELPSLPKRENWNRKFLSADEANKVVDVALGQKIAARLPPQPVVAPIDPALIASNNLPPIDADGAMQPLKTDQLTADEKAVFATLEPGSTKATQYLYVRGYLRYCRLVIAGTIQPLQLPKLPARANWNREHLSTTEATDVLDVALGMKFAARMSKPAQ